MTDELPDTTAAELALGLLDGSERADALRRVLAEPAFAAEVERWRTQFGGLFAAVPDAAPGDGVFDRVEASLAPAPAPAVVAPMPRRWAWPSIAAISSMAAAVLFALLVTRPAAVVAPPDRPTAPALLAAAVVPSGPESHGADAVSAVYDPQAGSLRLTAAALADARHAAELWVIGGDGVPHSLGLLRGGGATALIVAPADRPRLAAAAVLAVSIEPVGGSPTGLPTGPVVAKGVLSRT